MIEATGGRVFIAPPDTPAPTTTAPPWVEVGTLTTGEGVRFTLDPNLAEQVHEAFTGLARAAQSFTVSFRASKVQFARLWALAGGGDAERPPYVSRIRSDYRRRSRARVRRRR